LPLSPTVPGSSSPGSGSARCAQLRG
jgi:hypothetical protein